MGSIKGADADVVNTSSGPTALGKRGAGSSMDLDSTKVLQDLLDGGMGKTQANDRLVLKTLVFLERLDRACCRNHPKCDWGRDAPSFYGFLRRQYGVPATWPSARTNVDDFTEGAPLMGSAERRAQYNVTPSTRVAQGMEQRERRARVWARAKGTIEDAVQEAGVEAWIRRESGSRGTEDGES